MGVIVSDPKVLYMTNVIHELFGFTVKSFNIYTDDHGPFRNGAHTYWVVEFSGFTSEFLFYTDTRYGLADFSIVSCYVIYGGWCDIESFYDHDIVKNQVKGWIEKWQGSCKT